MVRIVKTRVIRGVRTGNNIIMKGTITDGINRREFVGSWMKLTEIKMKLENLRSRECPIVSKNVHREDSLDDCSSDV